MVFYFSSYLETVLTTNKYTKPDTFERVSVILIFFTIIFIFPVKSLVIVSFITHSYVFITPCLKLFHLKFINTMSYSSNRIAFNPRRSFFRVNRKLYEKSFFSNFIIWYIILFSARILKTEFFFFL